jgi:stage II sporulation protein R
MFRVRKLIAAALVLVFTAACGAYALPEEKKNQDYSKDLIRFHVIANSDSLGDQQLKRQVRDAILEQVGDKFKAVQSVAEAREIVLANLGEIEAAAEREIALRGRDYPVKASLGHFDFPAKTYGSFSLPAGNYEAVRVVIGEGQGENWWCVLFPPLCFVDISNSVSTEPEVRKVSKDMDEAVAEEGEPSPEQDPQEAEAEPVIQLKFKLFEVFNMKGSLLAEWRKETNDTLYAKQ